MNLFILDFQPEQAARYYNDSHVRKIILEAVEMMGYAYDQGNFKPLPWLSVNSRYVNHPMSIWVRTSLQNFDWTLQHTYGLLDEFAHRQKDNHQHAYRKHVDWIALNLPLKNLINIGQTDWPRCFGQFRERVGVTDNPVHDYRRYYMIAKQEMAKWTRRPTPEWFRYDSQS
jgi:hypothetical protein